MIARQRGREEIRMHRAVIAALVALATVCPAMAQSEFRTSAGQVSAHPYLTLDQLRARYADRHSRYFTFGGMDVHFKDQGKGPVLLLVHGSSSTMKTWDAMVPGMVRAGYRVIRYDVPGMGLSSDVPDSAIGAVQPADIAEALLAHRGVTRASVIGVSSGGTLGSFLAAKRPDLIERLIISNAPSDPVDTAHLVPTPEWAKAQADAKRTGFQDAVFWSEFLSYFAGDGRRIDTATRTHFYDFNRRTPHRNFIAMIAKVADASKARAAMAAVTAPTLLIWGSSDALLPPSAGRTLLKYLTATDAAIVYMPDVGHFPPIETPARFTRIALTWIEAGAPTRR
jgi:pimeloyl-ACP methyl ester carboxylesterase